MAKGWVETPEPAGYPLALYCKCGDTAIHTFQTPGAQEEGARLFSRVHRGNGCAIITEEEYKRLKKAGAFRKGGWFE